MKKVVSKEILKSQDVHRDPIDSLQDIIGKMGNEHEKEIVEKFEKQNQIIKIEKDKFDRKTCIEQTLSAIKNGTDKIYQAAIGGR